MNRVFALCRIGAPPLRRLHRACAVVVAAYALVHLANHVAGLAGLSVHLAFMAAARRVYRVPAVEAVLLASVAVQMATGLRMALVPTPARRSRLSKLQAASGVLLALFLAVHVGAVLAGRAALGLDTNFYFAAAGLHQAPWFLFFAPYYFLGTLALFAHIACAVQRRMGERSMPVLAGALIGGGALAGSFVASLAGGLYPVDIPAAYRIVYRPAGAIASSALMSARPPSISVPGAPRSWAPPTAR